MALSVNSFLENYVDKLRIDSQSVEGKKIQTSVENLIKNLKAEFGSDIVDVRVFGSYKRGTFLRRRFDENSDIDLMILFNHENLDVRPITYRKYLGEFSNNYYPNSLSFKSQPAIVLELNYIKYDLVPAYLDNDLYIPKSDTDWMTTEPDAFESTVNQKDKNNKNLIKPVIQLLKAWNAKAGYPLQSYFLEKEIVEDFYVFPKNLEDYFFNVIYWLNSSDKVSVDSKLDALKQNARKVRKALSEDKEKQAFTWLSHILPI
jgi:predicted nucleotidyltransferase